MKRTYPYILGSSAYIAGMGLTIASAWLITTASFQPPILTLSVAIVMVRFFGISRSVARYFERITSHKAVFDRLTQLRVRLFEKITANPISLVRDLGSGALVKRVVDDVERAQEYQLRITLPHVAAVISVLTGAALGWWIRPESLFITLSASFILLVLVPQYVKKRCEIVARGVESSESDYAALIEQAAHGVVEAELYGYLAERLSRTAQIEQEIWRKEQSLLTSTRRFQFLFVATLGLTLVALAELANYFSATSTIPAVQVTMLIFLPLVMFEGITAWYPNLFNAGKLLLARREIATLEEMDVDQPRSTAPLLSVAKEITAKNVQVRWHDREHFMEPVSFHVEAGESLVIRGRSGSGKSTLAMALLGLLDFAGEITLNRTPLRNISQLSTHVSGAIQSSHIFNTSIRENLKIAAPLATDAELMKVLALVELDSLIEELPAGLDTVIGQMGRALSGGEAKRLNLARALLSPAEILVLDEPTAHLDEELAARIEDRVMALGRILIVITHSGWRKGTRTIQLQR
ncbi:MAG: thiol reductant ABC exporter subunit CydC [Actinomycetota bacterium]